MASPQKKPTIEGKDLSSISQLLTTIAALLITIIGLRYIGNDLIAPLLMSIFLAVIMLPIFRWFRSKGFSPGISILWMITTFIASLVSLALFLSWSFSLLSQSLNYAIVNFQSILLTVMPADEFENHITNIISPEMIARVIGGLFGNLGSFFLYFLIIPILAMLLLLQIDAFSISAPKYLKQSNQIDRYQKFAQSIEIYVFGRFKVNLVTGLILSLALALLDIDFAIVWGLLTVILSFIPYIGIVIASVPPVLIALSTGGWVLALFVVIAVTAANLFAENVLDPYIQGKSNKLSTAAVVVAVVFWSWMLGAFGAIMAVPLTVLLKTILADYPETKWLASMMEGYYIPPDKNTQSKISKLTSHLSQLNPF